MRRPTLTQGGAGIVATVAGYASFRHIVHVAADAGESASVAAVLPFAVDGLILAATAAMAEDKRDGRAPRWSARVALAAGIGATLAANIASAHPGLISRCVAAWPALAFLLAVEVLARRGKLLPADEPVPDEPVPATLAEFPQRPADVPATGLRLRRRWRRGELAARVEELRAADPTLTADQLADQTGGTARHIARILAKVATA